MSKLVSPIGLKTLFALAIGYSAVTACSSTPVDIPNTDPGDAGTNAATTDAGPAATDSGPEKPPPPSCTNGSKDGTESDVDCGGGCPTKCADTKGCTGAADCTSGVCDPATKKCAAPTCSDTVKNGTETDADCGGSCPTKCADTKGCAGAADCASGVCDPAAKKCAPPTCNDTIDNGTETDVDCGGTCPTKCADTKGCAVAGDCASGVCNDGTKKCSAPACDDTVKNGTETDTDCGGACPTKCADTKGCAVPGDCASGVCNDGTKKCSVPACDDTVKNGTETDVDCGGGCATKCLVGKACAMNADCASGICADATKTCIAAPKGCWEIKTAAPASADGVYTIDPDGEGGQAPFQAYCDMTTDGGGWTVISYLRASSQWTWGLTANNGTVGDVAGGFSQGSTLNTANVQFNEKIIIYNALIENGVNLGKQWMAVRRADAAPIGFNTITTAATGWTYRDSYGLVSTDVTNICTHGCNTFAGHGMFHDYTAGQKWHGTQSGNYGCRDGNNICWMSRSLGCNVGSSRCAYLTGAGEGVVYAVRNK